MRVNDKEIENYEKANYFFSLVRKQTRKKRKCVTCGVPRLSMDAGDRYCSQCSLKVPHVGVAGTYALNFKDAIS